MKNLGLYIHIPFCMKKCIYCDFLSFPGRFAFTDKYIISLCSEIEEKSFLFKDRKIDSVFIGGGTPTSIDSSHIVKIMDTVGKCYDLTPDCEITIESNPGTLTFEKCIDYVKCGINRISIGLQSADRKILDFLGRIHTYEDYSESAANAKAAGFKNINTDLIFGIPGQTLDSFGDTLAKVVSAGVNHVSAYSLIPEEGTPLFDMLESGEVPYPDDGEDREMYAFARRFLAENGYVQYEISNFAKKGYESKHNLKYWEEKEYLGTGLGASSFYSNRRIKNTTDFEEYTAGKSVPCEDIFISEEEEMKEYMMLGFRKISGPDIEEFKKRYKIDMFEKFRKELDRLERINLIKTIFKEGRPESVRLTEKGLDYANEVFGEFI